MSAKIQKPTPAMNMLTVLIRLEHISVIVLKVSLGMVRHVKVIVYFSHDSMALRKSFDQANQFITSYKYTGALLS